MSEAVVKRLMSDDSHRIRLRDTVVSQAKADLSAAMSEVLPADHDVAVVEYVKRIRAVDAAMSPSLAAVAALGAAMVLVRPDGFVSWAGDTLESCKDILRTATGNA